VPNKIQLGPHLTQGLGAGANPQIGREATEESLEEIKRILEVNTKMVFITAGMGGGTGTGGAPIIAKICKDLGILTVGIVTTPFAYEGKKRIAQAENGISQLKDYVDTLLVISNDKLRHQFGNLTMKAAFSKADNVLATAAKCITDVISSTGQINVDFADVCTVMRNGGVAILGSAACEGESRAQKAIEAALNSPLLNDIYQQPILKFGDELQIKEETPSPEPAQITAQKPAMEPVLVETPVENIVELPQVNDKNTVDKKGSTIIHFELSSEEFPVTAQNSISAEIPKQEKKKSIKNKEASTVSSGGYLVKPSKIYVEDELDAKSKIVEEPTPLHLKVQADEPVTEMHLEVKDSLDATGEPEQAVQQTQPIMMSSAEEPLLVDDTDEQRRKAMERIAKLRNLSFNLNAADPNNEFESVPAYLRRNMELHNSIADVESFYSNYTVKSDQNNQAEISTINTFLEGKKPD
jgi:cell division protein FtsZ